MYEQISNSLKQIVNCSDAEIISFLEITTPQFRKYNRKQLILHEGEVCKHLYFIAKGCIRYFYNVNGEEKTGQFFFENGWYGDVESFITQQASEQNIQALEPTELFLISKDKLYQAYREIPIFERFGRLLMEKSFIGLHATNRNLTNLSPENGYLKLIKERPKVIQRIPLQYIASYLGIKAESLSRIRKRLFENKSNS